VASGAARGRVVAALEGGYDLEGIAGSTAATIGQMLGRPPRALGVPPQPGVERLLEAYRRVHAQYWSALRRP